MSNDNAYLDDILGQPASLRASLDAVAADELDRLGALPDRPRRVLFAGMGSSNFGAIPAATSLAGAGWHASVVSAGQLLHYEVPSIDTGTVLVLVSQSGRSAEIVRLIERLPSSIRVVGITNDASSPLAQRAQTVLPLNVAAEDSVTTRTYLATLVHAALLADAVIGKDWRTLATKIRSTLDVLEVEIARGFEEKDRVAAFLGEPACVTLIGRGYSLATVRAGALFVREVAKQPAADFDAAEFRHGPLEMVDATFSALVFAPAGVTHALNCALAHEIATKGGRAVLVTSEAPDWVHPGVLVVLQGTPACESLAPLIEVVPVQFLANSLALSRGHRPGVFRWSSKITAVE